MKKLLILLAFISLFSFVSADTNCSVGCDVDGGTLVNVDVTFTGFDSGASDVSIAIRDSNGIIVAIRDTYNIVDWDSQIVELDYFTDRDGNYTFEVFAQGTDNNYSVDIAFISSSSIETFSDSGCVGTSCGGDTDEYYLKVSGAPYSVFDDGWEFSPAMKGGTLATVTADFYDGQDICGYGSDPCDAALAVRRLSDNFVVAYARLDDWDTGPLSLDWYADRDGNYAVEVVYEAYWVQYDLNVNYTSILDQNILKSDIYQYIGINLGTGQTSQYFFDVEEAPATNFDDGLTFTPIVKGGTLMEAYIDFYNGQDVCGYGSDPCDIVLAVRRQSDDAVVAYKLEEDWDTGPFYLDWFADYDGNYALEVSYEGYWVQYDLNVVYTSVSDQNTLKSDVYQYVGLNLGTGHTSEYFFGVANSPVVVFDDSLSVPYKAKAGTTFSVSLRSFDGQNICDYGSSPCDVELRIVRVSDENEMAYIRTEDWADWSINPVTLDWIVEDGEEEYYVKINYEAYWMQYDLNVDYIDTVDNNRHYEDKYHYIGRDVTTSYETDYYFDGGLSCGDGVHCPDSACEPVILNGPTHDKIDVVFIGSGFPDSNGLLQAVNFAVDFDGDENGLMSHEPFKSYDEEFNFWMLDLGKTYNVHDIGNGVWRFDDEVKEDAKDNCGFGNEFAVISINPRFRSYVVPSIYKNNEPTGDGTSWAHLLYGSEFLCDCNFPIDYNGSNPPDSACQGSGYSPTCNTGASNLEELQTLFPHEFGHSFGGLWDEYNYNTTSRYASSGGLANCDDEYPSCPKWAEDVNACISPCGYTDWYKPFPRTLMGEHYGFGRTEYELISSNRLEDVIQSYDRAKYPDDLWSYVTYFFNFSYENGVFSLNDITFANSDPPELIDTNKGSFKVEFLSSSGEVLTDLNFNVPTTLLYEPYREWFDENGTQIVLSDENVVYTMDDVNFIIALPYFVDGATLNLKDENGSLLLSVDTSEYMTKIDQIIGGGGGSIDGQNYTMTYTITQQPTGILNSASYKAEVGWSVYYE
jgi:hypothetical protein